LPMMAQWLATPAVREWWGNPATELALVTEDLDNVLMDQRICSLDGTPFGYVQSYLCAAWRAPQFHDQPDDARAMDTCLGVPEMLGKGHGSAMVRLYAEALLAEGAPAVVIDPDPANIRAIHAYRRAGFRDIAIRPCEDGDPVLVMRLDPAFIFP
jgi:aminoglycoside 6'-N-acetyltransferase